MTAKVLIYGGSGGTGAALARQLVARGESVHLVGRDATRLQAVADPLSATYTVGDVNDTSLFARATTDAGAITGLVYAVGSIRIQPLTRTSADEFLNDFRINALGAALAVQAANSALKQGSGDRSIVLFSSVAAAQGFAFHASIAMAKAAINGLTLALAAELAPRVRVNAIAPSLTKTEMAAPLLSRAGSAEGIALLHSLPRLGEPEDLAALAAFLLSDQATWITGQVFGVDGGRSSLRTKG